MYFLIYFGRPLEPVPGRRAGISAIPLALNPETRTSMFPLSAEINLDDLLPIGDANDTRPGAIVNETRGTGRPGRKRGTPGPFSGFAAWQTRPVTLRKTAAPDRMCTQCLDSSSRSTAYTRCMCTRARAQRLAVSMRGSNLIPGKRPSAPQRSTLYLPLPFSTSVFALRLTFFLRADSFHRARPSAPVSCTF